MMNNLRPDEQAMFSEIERASQRNKKLKKGIKTASTITSLGIGTALGSRILPLLNEFVPVELALKGINKINPQLGNILKYGMEKGLDVKEGLNFLKNNISSNKETEEQKRQQALGEFNKKIKKDGLRQELTEQFEDTYGQQQTESLNIIAQYSPQLHQFLKDEIQKGRPLEEAGALAYLQNNFKKVISKLEQDYRSPFSKILESVFGKKQQATQQNQQMGQGQTALMEAIQKLRQIRGK